jgi:hypothetical protein
LKNLIKQIAERERENMNVNGVSERRKIIFIHNNQLPLADTGK